MEYKCQLILVFENWNLADSLNICSLKWMSDHPKTFFMSNFKQKCWDEKPSIKHNSKTIFTLCVLEVVSPQRSYFILTTNVPNCEWYIFSRGYRFHIESNCWNSTYVFVQFHFIQYSCLSWNTNFPLLHSW